MGRTIPSTNEARAQGEPQAAGEGRAATAAVLRRATAIAAANRATTATAMRGPTAPPAAVPAHKGPQRTCALGPSGHQAQGERSAQRPHTERPHTERSSSPEGAGPAIADLGFMSERTPIVQGENYLRPSGYVRRAQCQAAGGRRLSLKPRGRNKHGCRAMERMSEITFPPGRKPGDCDAANARKATRRTRAIASRATSPSRAKAGTIACARSAGKRSGDAG